VIGDIFEIGTRLIAVRKALAHGQWLPWLDREFGWKEVTAWNYINVAERFKSSTVEDLPIDASALYLLASPSVPEEVREEAVKEAESGTRITRKKANELIAEARREERATADKRIAELEAAIAKADEEITAELVTTVEQRTKPLDQKINDLTRERDEANESLRKLREAVAEAPPKAKDEPPIDGTKSFRAHGVFAGLEGLEATLMTISAEDAVAITREAERVNGQPAVAKLDPALRRARVIVGWLSDFVEAADA
jgi:hypothetical protein